MAQIKRRGANVLGGFGVTLLMASILIVSGCGDDDQSQAEYNKGSLIPAAQNSAHTGVFDSTAIADTNLGVHSRSTEMPSLEPAAVDGAAGDVAGIAASASEKTSQMAAKKEPNIAAEGDFSVQIGSFRSAENARALMGRVIDMGYRPEVEVASLGGQTYHRVIVKGLVSRQEAERCGEDIRSTEGITYLIRHQK